MHMKRRSIGSNPGSAPQSRIGTGLFSAWWISVLGAFSVLGYLLISRPTPYRDILKFIPDGILVTFEITIISIFFSLILGLITGFGRVSKNRLINLIASIYIEVVRGIPLLVQLFYIYYALGRVVRLPDMAAAIIAMTLCYGAYMGEVFRAGMESIPTGQMEAALSQGFNRRQAIFQIILPQAWRTILPPVGNEFIALLKDTSLVSILAVADLLRRGREFASETFAYFETYTVIALVYLIITLILSKFVSIMEKKLSNHAR